MRASAEDYAYGLSLTSQLYFCGIPFRLDTYSRCSYDCVYCSSWARGGNRGTTGVLLLDAEKLRRRVDRALDGRSDSVVAQMLRRRMPVHFGGMTDPFPPEEKARRATLRALEVLCDHGYPVVVSTKGTLVAEPEYVAILSRMTAVVQFSFCSGPPGLQRRLEPNAPSRNKRFGAMATLANAGILTAARVQPILPVDDEQDDIVERVAAAGGKHVIAELLKVPVEQAARDALSEACGQDMVALYRKLGATRIGRKYVLPVAAKVDRLLRVRSIAHAESLVFGAAENDLRSLGDSACCCCIDGLPGFENWYRHQISFAVFNACRGRMRYSSIADEWCPSGSLRRVMNSRSRRAFEGIPTARSLVRAKWNAAGSPHAPDSYWGVAWDGEVDESGMKTYGQDVDVAGLVREHV